MIRPGFAETETLGSSELFDGEDALKQLEERLAHGGKVSVIQGDPGTGKTYLLKRFAEYKNRSGSKVDLYSPDKAELGNGTLNLKLISGDGCGKTLALDDVAYIAIASSFYPDIANQYTQRIQELTKNRENIILMTTEPIIEAIEASVLDPTAKNNLLAAVLGARDINPITPRASLFKKPRNLSRREEIALHEQQSAFAGSMVRQFGVAYNEIPLLLPQYALRPGCYENVINILNNGKIECVEADCVPMSHSNTAIVVTPRILSRVRENRGEINLAAIKEFLPRTARKRVDQVQKVDVGGITFNVYRELTHEIISALNRAGTAESYFDQAHDFASATDERAPLVMRAYELLRQGAPPEMFSSVIHSK